VRAFVLERDNHRCQVGLKKCRGKANTVDHIERPEEGGAEYDPANLRASCRSCNMVRHNAAYFREKVDAAASEPPTIVFSPAGRPGPSDRRFLDWAMALPLTAEPDDHHHRRWAMALVIYARDGRYKICPASCDRAPVRWRVRSAT
jgi:hypothetical protein